MILIWLKKRKEFQKVCQGRIVYFSVYDDEIHYFAPAKANEIEVLYAFDSKTPVPLREHHDFEDEDGVYVQQLIQVDGLYCLDTRNIVPTSIYPVEQEAY